MSGISEVTMQPKPSCPKQFEEVDRELLQIS